MFFFNNTFSFYLSYCKHHESFKNILKQAKFVRKFKIANVYLNKLRQDYPNFGLSYLYEC